MELLNESPPTGVLSGMSQAASSGSAASRLDSSQQSAAVFGSNSGALSLQKSAGVDQLNLRCSTNNLSSAFSSSSLCLALGSAKFPPNSSSSNSLKSDAFVHCSPTIPDSQQQRNSNNFLNCENSSAAGKFDANKFEGNKFDGNKFDTGKFDSGKHCLTGAELSSISSLVSNSLVHGGLGLHASSSLSSPVSTSTNSIKSSSSSFSSSSNSLCFGNNAAGSVNNNLANLSSLSNNLHQPPNQPNQPSNSPLFCAQQLFNSANNQQKVKRTRQRVDAGEPRNSYASIANYATSRLGKAPRNFPNSGLPGAKGLFDQLGYLGLNALLTGNSFSPDDFLLPNSFANPVNPSSNVVNNSLVGNNLVGNNLVSNNLVNNSLVNSNLVNSSNSNPISSLLASLATNSEKSATSSPFNASGQPLDSPEQVNGKLTSQQQMLLSQSFHWNTNSNPPQSFGNGDSPLSNPVNQPPFGQQPDQQARQPSDLSASHPASATASANLIEPPIGTMAKSRFSEDAVTLEYAKVSKHSEFTDSAEPLANSNPPMTPNDLVLPVKPTAMETTSEENKIANHDQQLESANEPARPNLKEENDENNKNRENNQKNNKSPPLSASNSRSNSASSSRCSSPTPNHNEADHESNNPTDTATNEHPAAKESRVDTLVNSLNKLVAERLNSNSSSSCTTGSSETKGENGKMNGNCKSSRRRKTDQPQQCKVEDEEELKEFNEMNQMDELNDKDDLYKEELDDEMDDEMDYSTGHQQQIEELRKFKALEAILQQFSLQQQLNNTLNPALGNQLNQQLSHQLNQQLTNQINNLRSTRVSDRGRMNGQANSSNNSANSTPVNLSINSPRPDEDEYLTNSRNQEFYEPPTKFELDQFSSLASNLCKEFSVLLEDLRTELSSRKANFQSKLRARFDQFLNGGDQDLEQFFSSTKEHLTSTVVQLIDVNFQRYKTKVVLQNFHGSFGNNNANNLNNSLTINQLNQISQSNQSSKNLQSAMLLNNSANRQRKNELRSNNLSVSNNLNSNGNNLGNNLNNNSSANDLRSSNLVDQLNRLQRSSPNLLAGLDAANSLATSKLFQNINSNLNTANLNPNFNDFKAPFGGLLADGNLPGQNLSLMQHLLHAQEEQLQKQLQKENQQDCAFAPKRKRIKASDEPRRTRTSNRITPNSLGSIGQSIGALNQTVSAVNVLPPKSTSEMLANLVSREFNNATPLAHNLNHSTNASLSNSLNNVQENESSANHQSTNNSMNSSVFPFNNSFMNSFGQGDLDVQQLMMAVNNGLNNGQNSSNRASPLSSFGGNLSAGQAPFLLDQSSDNSMSNDLDGAVESTSTLSPVHLRKAKLMFFYVRYPNSAILKTYFRDIRFNKNNTAQLVKWFSNFREFYYQQIDKYARQELSNGRQNAEEIHIPADSELIKVLNVHYNRQNHISVPNDFVDCVQATVREFFRAIQANRDDNEPSWRKPIYKVISRYDKPVPECFRQPNFLEALESNYTEI